MTFDVKIGETYYALVRDPAHIHPPEVHARLGTTSEAGLRRLLDAVEDDEWFDGNQYVGRDPFGIGIAGIADQITSSSGAADSSTSDSES